MLVESRTPTHQELVSDLQELREKGLTNLRRLRPEALHRAAHLCGLTESAEPEPAATETLLAAAVEAQGGGTLQSKLQLAAEYTFGLVPGTRDWPAQDRRKEAARVYGVRTERFRKAQEKTVYEQVAEEILKLCHRARSRTEASLGTESALADGQAHTVAAAPIPSIDRSRIPHLFTVDDHPGRSVELRLMTDIPPFSLLVAEKSNPDDSFLQVQLNFLYARISRDRPIVRVYRHDPWFDRSYAEFKAIWKEHSEPSTPDWLLEHIDPTE